MTPSDRIRRIVADHLRIDPAAVTDDASFHELGAKDLDVVSIVMAVEDTFDFELRDEDVERAKTIGTLVALVGSALGDGSIVYRGEG